MNVERSEIWLDKYIGAIMGLPEPLVFTDGSFNTNGRMIKLLEGDAKGRGCGAVVVMDRNFSEHPVYSWRFKGREDFLFNSAFDVETMMVCAGLKKSE